MSTTVIFSNRQHKYLFKQKLEIITSFEQNLTSPRECYQVPNKIRETSKKEARDQSGLERRRQQINITVFGTLHRVVSYKLIDVSEVFIASIIRAIRLHDTRF
jgi:hypothetical protein